MAAETEPSSKNILVAGDFVLDYHIYEGRRYHYGDRVDDGVKVKSQLGGAALVHQIVCNLLKPSKDARSPVWRSSLAISDPIGADRAGQPLASGDASMHAYAFWRPMPRGAPCEQQFWRVSEAMGFGSAERTSGPSCWTPVDAFPSTADIVTLSEGGMGFRESRSDWHEEKLAAARWIVLKTTAPVTTGLLWERLTAGHADKLIVIVSSWELRRSPARVSAGLSWEKTIQDVLRELGSNGAFRALTRCRHLILTFGTEGVLWFNLDGEAGRDGARLTPETPVRFLYDASAIEGDHARAVEGGAYGFSSCLAAAVTWKLALDLEDPDFSDAVEAGLCAMRDLRESGHGRANEQPDGFPSKRIAEAIARPAYLYSSAAFRAGDPGDDPARDLRWSLLQHSQLKQGPSYELARLVLLRGPIALANLPHLRIGDFITPDWHEIESLRSLMQIIRRYREHDPGRKPLSIGVFGPPGAGKSFAVRELAKHLVGASTWMEFNLSQFSVPAELIGAFHQIRDRVLQGGLPVVFFDEFDSQSYRWLKHLLAPMQDGHFQDGQLTHPVGKCILVFAGGTSWTFETLGPPEPAADAKPDQSTVDDFRLAKGPDFKSRLDGYLNVVGPNQRQAAASREMNPPQGAEWFGGRWFTIDPDDIHFPLRRALMIRAELKCAPDEKLDIDEGLVHALLHVSRYTHGARSLGKVVQPLAAVRPNPLRQSFLLPTAQLNMHVPAQEFLDLCGQARPSPFRPGDPLTEEQIKLMASAIHETYRELGRNEGWLKPEIDQDFGKLDNFFKDSNLASAGRMLEILGLVGLRLEKGTASPDEEEMLRARLEYSLETLAEAEHDGWMAWHFARGWRYGPKRDDSQRLHNCLLPYTGLPMVEANKDRHTIRKYPQFARKAGMKIVFV